MLRQDEVHERDGLTDFLLTKMKELVQKTPSLKLILSSAALDVNLFVRYFGACPVIHSKRRNPVFMIEKHWQHSKISFWLLTELFDEPEQTMNSFYYYCKQRLMNALTSGTFNKVLCCYFEDFVEVTGFWFFLNEICKI